MQTTTLQRPRTSVDRPFGEGIEVPNFPPLVIPDLPPLVIPDPIPLVIPTPEPPPVVEPARSFQAADLVLWGAGFKGERLDAAATAIRRDNSAMRTPLIPDYLREAIERRIPTRAERDEIRRRFPIIRPTRSTTDVPDHERDSDDAPEQDPTEQGGLVMIGGLDD